MIGANTLRAGVPLLILASTIGNGVNSLALQLRTSRYSSTGKEVISQNFVWQAQSAGGNTSLTAHPALLPYYGITTVRARSWIAPYVQITFAPPQTFSWANTAPRSGLTTSSLTGVAAGAGSNGNLTPDLWMPPLIRKGIRGARSQPAALTYLGGISSVQATPQAAFVPMDRTRSLFSGNVAVGTTILCHPPTIGGSSAAINACIAEAGSGGTVQIVGASSGYLLDSQLRIEGLHKLTFECPSHSVLYIAAPDFDMLNIGTASSGITVRGCHFVGASVAAEGYAAIRVADGPKTTIEEVEINGTNDGIVISKESSDYCEVRGNRIHDLVGGTSGNGYGVYTIGQHTIIADNNFVNVPRHDIYLSGSRPNGASYATVIGNKSLNNGAVAIGVYATATEAPLTGDLIVGNSITGFQGVGIALSQNVVDALVEGNTLSGGTNTAPYNHGIAIYLNGSTGANTFPTGNTIRGNMLINNAGTIGNITAFNSINNKIEGNQCFNAKVWCILVNIAGKPALPPTGNTIRNNTSDNSAGFTDYALPNNEVEGNFSLSRPSIQPKR